MRKLLTCLVAIASLSGCGLSNVYRMDVQQGNVFSDADLTRLKPGMSREQVLFIMGTPVVGTPFRDERWEYFYSLSHGADGTVERRQVTILFKGDALDTIERSF